MGKDPQPAVRWHRWKVPEDLGRPLRPSATPRPKTQNAPRWQHGGGFHCPACRRCQIRVHETGHPPGRTEASPERTGVSVVTGKPAHLHFVVSTTSPYSVAISMCRLAMTNEASRSNRTNGSTSSSPLTLQNHNVLAARRLLHMSDDSAM